MTGSSPHSVEHLQFETKAKFVLAIETGGMFQRLNNHKFWRDNQSQNSGAAIVRHPD